MDTLYQDELPLLFFFDLILIWFLIFCSFDFFTPPSSGVSQSVP